MKNKLKFLLIYIFVINEIKCQYSSDKYRHSYIPFRSAHGLKGYNVYTNDDQRNSAPVKYYYKHEPVEVYEEARPERKPYEAHVYEEYTPEEEEKAPEYVHSNSDSEEDRDQHYSNSYKEGAGKKFANLAKHTDSGHKEAELAKIGAYHDKQLEGKKELEHKDYKHGGEYSHDRGHGFIKAWSWDRAHAKNAGAGKLTKKLAEFAAKDKGAHVAVAAKASEGHDKKDVSAAKGGAGYVKAGNEESSEKISTSGKSDFDKEFPIFG